MPDPIPRNSRAGIPVAPPQRPMPPPAPPPAPAPVQPAPVYNPPRRNGGGGFGQALIAVIFVGVLIFAFGGLSVLDGFVRQVAVVVFPPSSSGGSTGGQYQATSIPSGSGRSTNPPTALPPVSSSANCSPATRFSVGMTAAVDTASTSGASTRIAAWTQPSGGIHNSDAEPGMYLSIVGGPQCVYNSEYQQYVRYWQVEFTNRNGRYVAGDAWVAESVWEGSSVNYLICLTSNPDC